MHTDSTRASPSDDSRTDLPSHSSTLNLNDPPLASLLNDPKITAEFDSSIYLEEPIIDTLKSQRTLIVYACYTAPYAQINTAFFIDFGIFPSDTVDFVIISNGEWPIMIPKHLQNNVRVVYSPEEGRLDFFAWRDALKRVAFDHYTGDLSELPRNVHSREIIARLQKKYRYFMLLNSSVRGPFLQSFLNPQDWPYHLLKYLDNRVKLVGLIYNYDYLQIGKLNDYRLKRMKSSFHVQSMVLGFDAAFLYVNWYTLFNEGVEEKMDTYIKELLTTQNMLDAGYRTHVVTWSQIGMDPQGEIKITMDHSREPNPCRTRGYNFFVPHCYIGGIHPDLFEFMFTKTHNPLHLDPQEMERVANMYTRFYYHGKLQCDVPNPETQGASCRGKGAWLHRNEYFECARLASSTTERELYAVSERINQMQHKRIIDIGGAYGRECAALLSHSHGDDIQCTVVEPAPMYGCMEENVRFIRGNILDTNFDAGEEKFDAALLLHTLPHMNWNNTEAVGNLVSFLKLHVEKELIIAPYEEVFVKNLQSMLPLKGVVYSQDSSITILQFEEMSEA